MKTKFTPQLLAESSQARDNACEAITELYEALSRWAQYARDNGYSENESDAGYCSFLQETRAALAKVEG